ncbi:MAG: CBS domain-containing protein [Candidatus Schekmanbacteria bacterium]|nr:CBS domain-containing protein [Candidatus Schekmanbacteria bacterium]
MKVSEFMITDVLKVDAHDPLELAAALMREHRVGMLVVERDGKVCGFLTARDIVYEGVAALAEGKSVAIGDITRNDLVTVHQDSDLFDVVRVMGNNRRWYIGVTDNAGECVGIVSVDDVMVIMISEFSHVADVVTRYSKLL